MGVHSDRARETLLDAAEELFARDGIDAVSNRRITEHAGTANHSAITYHFGGRDELLRALLARYYDALDRRRDELVAALGPNPELSEIVACRILPWVEQLASLPVPSWRARFLFQARTAPSLASLLADTLAENTGLEELFGYTKLTLGGIPPEVLRARSAILGPMVLGVCAEYEARIESGSDEGNWVSVGYFLIDAITGMLAAPVSHPGRYVAHPSAPGLI